MDIIDGDSGQGQSQDQVKLTKPLDSFEEDQKIYGSIDPRSDKMTDHKYWEDILWNAWHFVKPFYHDLHGIRCGGAELTLVKDSFRLLPGEWTAKEWDEIKQQYLDPIKGDLIRLLRLTRFGKVTEKTLPKGIFDESTVVKQGGMFG